MTLRCITREWIDPLRVFRAAEGLPGLVFLDSGGEIVEMSRWTFLAVRPVETLRLSVGAGTGAIGSGSELSRDDGGTEENQTVRYPGSHSGDLETDPFAALAALHSRWRRRTKVLGRGSLGDSEQQWQGDVEEQVEREVEGEGGPHPPGANGAVCDTECGSNLPPFTGGVVALVGYDCARVLERLPAIAEDDPGLPDLWAAAYDGVVAFDRVNRRVIITSWGLEGSIGFTELESILDAAEAERARTPGADEELGGKGGDRDARDRDARDRDARDRDARDQDLGSRQAFLEGVARVREEIARGEIYQANLTRRIVRPVSDDDAPLLYERLRKLSPTPFGAWVDGGTFRLLSASPERFVRISGGIVETRPIKGTRPRGRTREDDDALREELLASAKDRAELLMIVDLERNDLGRVCEPGSVEVADFPRIEAYSNVWHLVATVRGRLRRNVTPETVLRATFPGGSITGAPKLRAMEILEGLEKRRRKFSMGSLLAWDFGGNLDSSILIRTLVVRTGEAVFNVGGGIVADSSPEAEYRETMDKAAPLMACLESSMQGPRPASPPSLSESDALPSASREAPPGPSRDSAHESSRPPSRETS